MRPSGRLFWVGKCVHIMPHSIFSPQRPSTTFRLCKDCQFYKPVLTRREGGLCTLCGTIDLVTGEKQPLLAEDARSELCEEDAQFFVRGNARMPALFHWEGFDVNNAEHAARACAIGLGILLLTALVQQGAGR